MIFGTETGKGRRGGALLDLIQRTSFSLSLSRPLFNNTSLHAPVFKKRSQGGALKLWSGHKKSKLVKEDTFINLDREQKVGMRHFVLSTMKTTA